MPVVAGDPIIDDGAGKLGALVVLSGGLDSTVALAHAVQEHGQERVSTISFYYGQRHDVEVKAAKEIADYYHVPHFVQEVWLGRGGVLMDPEAEMPHKTYEELGAAQGPSPTYVPYRNGTFLSLAASHAMEMSCSLIYAGMHAEDAHNWAYPDCTPEFLGAMQNAIYVGTYHKVRFIPLFTYNKKWEIVAYGLDLKVPFEKTHSCYEGQRPACGKCPTCVARLEAFKELDEVDPLPYQSDTGGTLDARS